VTVPTVERGLLPSPFCSMAMAGLRPSMLSTLAFRVDRVERQGRFPRAARPGDHDQAIARQITADVLQVVLRGAANDEEIHTGNGTV